jgi:MATE family multidrug resistance protein
MSIVDTIMVGPLGPAAIGAVGPAAFLFMTLMVIGLTLLALDTFVAQSYGAGRWTNAIGGCLSACSLRWCCRSSS